MCKKILASLIAWLALLAINGCDLVLFKKNKPKPLTELEKLPPATQQGKNTFGCLVSGKAWVPKTSTDFQADLQGFLSIGATLYLSNSQSQSMGITANLPIVSGSAFDFTNYQVCSASFSSYINSTLCEYKTTNTYEGNLTISKIDYQQHIISGTFNFSTVIIECDTLKITNGRFDIKYIP